MKLPEKWRGVKESRGFREFYFFAIALVLAFGVIQTTGTVLDTDKPVVSVVSCSMHPQLQVGDILLVEGVEFEQIEKGQIIVYSTPEMDIPVVHRVIETGPGHLETKGDNNPDQLDFEKNVTPAQVHGTVLFRIPRVGGLKILAMDLAGLNGGSPLIVDSYPVCRQRT